MCGTVKTEICEILLQKWKYIPLYSYFFSEYVLYYLLYLFTFSYIYTRLAELITKRYAKSIVQVTGHHIFSYRYLVKLLVLAPSLTSQGFIERFLSSNYRYICRLGERIHIIVNRRVESILER